MRSPSLPGTQEANNVSETDLAPNVVVIITDDQGYGDIGCHSNPYIRTPNLDALYEESVRFTDFHVGPTCAPTRAGIMTGHYANSAGVWHTVGGRSLLRQGERTVADIFASAGYSTGLFGKWHLGDNFPYRPQDRGFQHVVTHGGGGIGNTPDYWGNDYFDDRYCVDGEWKQFAGYCTDVWFQLGMNFIDEHHDRPFMCFITPNAPHAPYIAPEKHSSYYRKLCDSDEQAAKFFGYPDNTAMWRFYGMIESIDENIGLLRRHLKNLRIADNTILIFMSDNGTSAGVECDSGGFAASGYSAGMRGKKGSAFEGGHRVPLFLHWSRGGYFRGIDIDTLSANIDLLPTLMELCGIEDISCEDEFHGISLVPLLNGERNVSDRTVVTDSQRIPYPKKWRRSCAMWQEWRLINGEELYNIRDDPEQRKDLADEYPNTVSKLRADYDDWWSKVSVQFDEDVPIDIGARGFPEVTLTSHDWRNELSAGSVWNQVQVRAGILLEGYWEINVVQAGRYKIVLRRWPKEETRALREGIPGTVFSDYRSLEEHGYGGGRSIPVCRARITVNGMNRKAQLHNDDRHAAFDVDLESGPAHLSARFVTDDDNIVGAYYVYISGPLEN